MKTVVAVMILAVGLAGSAMGQPAIRAENGVLNASSNAPDIARGSWFVIYGTGMGPATISIHTAGVPYPMELSGTKVTFTPASGGAAVEARMWYSWATQVAGLLPSGTAAGDYDVRVIYNGQTSAPYRVKVVERNFGFATQAQTGAGPAQATYGGMNLNRFTTGAVGQWEVRPAKAGDTLVLWGTGLGPDSQSDVNGGSSGNQTDAAQVRVIVGGVEITPAYAGRSGGSPGLDQINFTLPAGIPTGCLVGLRVRAGGRMSNAGTLAIVNPGEDGCTHPVLSRNQLRKLDEGGTLLYGSFSLASIASKITIPGLGSIDSRTETISGSFGRYRIDQVALANFSVTIGACTVARRTGGLSEVAFGNQPDTLDAGAALSLARPGGNPVSVPKVVDKDPETDEDEEQYSASLGSSMPGAPASVVPGTYTLTGPGGADIRAFTASIQLPGTLTWTNQDQITEVDRSQPLPILWSGVSSGLVTISGMAGEKTGGTEEDPIYDVAVFACVVPAAPGSYTVPVSVLQQLPAATFNPLAAGFGMLSVIAVPAEDAGKFEAQLTAGGTVDTARFDYAVGHSKTLSYK